MRVLTTKIRQGIGRFIREYVSWENPRVGVAQDPSRTQFAVKENPPTHCLNL